MLERLSHNFRFEGKLENEEVHYVFFKHVLSEIREWLFMFFLYVLPLLTLMFFSFLLPANIVPVVWVFSPFYFIFIGSYIFIAWLNDICDICLLTNKRIIDITQNGFLSRKTSIAELHNIQNVNFSQKGPVDAMFNIGNVDIQTAGSSPDLEIDFVESPSEIADLILTYARNYRKDPVAAAPEAPAPNPAPLG